MGIFNFGSPDPLPLTPTERGIYRLAIIHAVENNPRKFRLDDVLTALTGELTYRIEKEKREVCSTIKNIILGMVLSGEIDIGDDYLLTYHKSPGR